MVKEIIVFSEEVQFESPTLFNIHSVKIILEALEEHTTGIRFNGRPISNIWFADNTIIIAECLKDLQLMVDRVVEVSEEK